MAERWQQWMRRTLAEDRRDAWWDSVGLVLFTYGQEAALEEIMKLATIRTRGDSWVSIRTSIFHRDDFTCRYCGDRGGRLECDHVIPVSRGGSDDSGNLVTACFRCNRAKGAQLLEEWRPELCL